MTGKGLSENCDRYCTKPGGSHSNFRMAAQQAYYMLTRLDLPCARVFFDCEPPSAEGGDGKCKLAPMGRVDP